LNRYGERQTSEKGQAKAFWGRGRHVSLGGLDSHLTEKVSREEEKEGKGLWHVPVFRKEDA